MRTYKTWEVVKILMENPRLRFEAKINKKNQICGLILMVI